MQTNNRNMKINERTPNSSQEQSPLKYVPQPHFPTPEQIQEADKFFEAYLALHPIPANPIQRHYRSCPHH
jgi:hypothetical protein